MRTNHTADLMRYATPVSEETVRHPEHDRLIHVVPGWYHHSSPEMGYYTERRKFGFYCRNLKAQASVKGQVSVKNISPSEIQKFLTDLRQYFGNRPVQIWIDDRETDAQVCDAFVASGCTRHGPISYLAQVGPTPEISPVPGLKVESVTLANLAAYAKTKLMGFTNSESEPSRDKLEEEMALRRAEMDGLAQFRLARVGNKAAGIIGWYDIDSDRLIFQVTTRIPFRHRGIAKHLVSYVLTDAYEQGIRAVIINADQTDMPIEIYRWLGFIDEVFWRQGYKF